MKTIQVQEFKVYVDDEDYLDCLVRGLSIRTTENYSTVAYSSGKLRGKILARVLMKCPEGMYVDHKDGNPFNNCKDNLRICTRAQNRYNSKAFGESGVKGVCKDGNRWTARITINGKTNILGTYNTKAEAAIAYQEAAEEIQGEFAFHNSRSAG